jgi:hypothetical protein
MARFYLVVVESFRFASRSVGQLGDEDTEIGTGIGARIGQGRALSIAILDSLWKIALDEVRMCGRIRPIGRCLRCLIPDVTRSTQADSTCCGGSLVLRSISPFLTSVCPI